LLGVGLRVVLNGGKVLGLIPARGGSKGVPRKNVRLLGGKPLLQWTTDAATESRLIDRLVLSTEDSEIAELGRSLGVDVPFLRPEAAATDEASAHHVIEHALASLDEAYEYLVYLQPTSPFRTALDIDGCLETLAASNTETCVSVSVSRAKPEWLFYLEEGSRLKPVLGELKSQRRQELRTAYELNGAVYAARVAAYRARGSFFSERTAAWVMPADRSIDLDELDDFERAEALLQPGAGVAG
jgi:N-acylneuraminate cytidylyltransferase